MSDNEPRDAIDPLDSDSLHQRNFLATVSYQIMVRVGWIFKTESIIMPAALDSLGASGFIRGFLPMFGRFGQSIPPLLIWPLLISARTFVDKYGPANRYDILAGLKRIDIESLIVFGEKELTTFNGAFYGLPESIQAIERKPPIAVTTIAGADHFYTDKLAPLTEAVIGWLGNDAMRTGDDD